MSTAITPPIRDKFHPAGLPGLSAELAKRVKQGNSFCSWSRRLVRICEEEGKTLWWLEQPDSSWFWKQRSWKRAKFPFVRFDMCAYGAPWRKRTRLASNASELPTLRRLCSRDHEHQVLRGCPAGSGTKWTRLAQAFPEELCFALARMVLDSWRSQWKRIWKNSAAESGRAVQQ